VRDAAAHSTYNRVKAGGCQSTVCAFAVGAEAIIVACEVSALGALFLDQLP
jgi:hypothetical protein